MGVLSVVVTNEDNDYMHLPLKRNRPKIRKKNRVVNVFTRARDFQQKYWKDNKVSIRPDTQVRRITNTISFSCLEDMQKFFFDIIFPTVLRISPSS